MSIVEESVSIVDPTSFFGAATEWKRDARAPLCHASVSIVDASAPIHHQSSSLFVQRESIQD